MSVQISYKKQILFASKTNKKFLPVNVANKSEKSKGGQNNMYVRAASRGPRRGRPVIS